MYSSIWIGFDSPLKFIVVAEGWSYTVLVVLEAHFFCRETVEPAVGCPKGSNVSTQCIVDVSGCSVHVVVFAPLVVDDCSKLGFTYHSW